MAPHSIVSHGFLPYNDRMSFIERTESILYTIYMDQNRQLFHLEKQNSIARNHFKYMGKLPWIEDILLNNISLVMTYSHRAIFSPRPALPNMINIGGAHLTKPKKLPADIQKFLDGAVHGAIYFSLGTVLNSEDMPSDKLNIFLGRFCVFCFYLFLDIVFLNQICCDFYFQVFLRTLPNAYCGNSMVM